MAHLKQAMERVAIVFMEELAEASTVELKLLETELEQELT